MSEQLLDRILLKVLEIDERLNTFPEIFVTKNELQNVKNEIITTIDHFATLHETLDLELLSVRSKYERLEDRIKIVETKLGLAN